MTRVRCESDDPGIKAKYAELAESILTDSNSRSVSGLFIVASMREGYFIASADLRKAAPPQRLEKVVEFEQSEKGTLIRIDQEKESMIPSVVSTLRLKFGDSSVSAIERYTIEVTNASVEDLRNVAIEPSTDERVENAAAVLRLISPEAFRITKTVIAPGRLTVLCSQKPLKPAWVKRMNDVHSSTRSH